MENTSIMSSIGFEQNSPHEAYEEFMLPDYMPEVRRIVSCSATVLPDSRYIDQNGVTLSGIVVYTVLYIGDDGGLNSAPLSTEYTHVCPVRRDEGDLSGASLCCKTQLESVVCRATAPRALKITSRLKSKLFYINELAPESAITATGDEGTEKVSSADESSIERRCRTVESVNVRFVSGTGSSSGEMQIPDGAKIISCIGRAAVFDTQVDGSAVSLRGDTYVECLCLESDGRYTTVRAKAPLEERITTDGTLSSSEAPATASASARCASVNLNGGTDSVYSWNMEYDIDATVAQKCSCEIIDDAYSTKYACNITHSDADALRVLMNRNQRLSISGSKQLIGSTDRSIALVSGRASIENAEVDPNGQLTLCGVCTVSVVCIGDGDAVSEDVQIPVRLPCDCRRTSGAHPYMITDTEVISADARIDGDRLSVNAELSITPLILESTEERFIGEISLDHASPVSDRGGNVTVYFPKPDETLWDIGKHYSCETREIIPCQGGTPVMILSK